MKLPLITGLFLSAFLGVCAGSAQAHQSPSLSATQKFLTDYLPRRFVTENGLNSVVQDGFWSFDGCKLSFSEKTTFIDHPFDKNYVPKSVYSIEVYPAEGEFDEHGENSPDGSTNVWYTSNSTADFRNVALGRISVVQDDEVSVAGFGGPLRWTIPFEDRKTAERVRHALMHLATVCGVKAEPF